jgi:DNA-binding beta-propeller fold protein YncE
MMMLVGALMVADVVRAAETIVANYMDGSLYKVDLTTGDRTVLVASGTISRPASLALTSDGKVLVGEGLVGTSKIFSVDPVSGVATVLSDGSDQNQGPSMYGIYGLAVEANGTIIATCYWSNDVFRINPSTGIRTRIASGLARPWGVVVESSGNILVSESNADKITRIDKVSLAITTVASGGSLGRPSGMAALSAGKIVVAYGASSNYAVSVDTTTGVQTVISSSGVGTGVAINGA